MSLKLWDFVFFFFFFFVEMFFIINLPRSPSSCQTIQWKVLDAEQFIRIFSNNDDVKDLSVLLESELIGLV